jgi:hypothetical protein
VQTTGDADVQLVADFVRRLRRVALHPLALDDQVGEKTPMPGDLLPKLMPVGLDGSVTVTPRRGAAADDFQRRR